MKEEKGFIVDGKQSNLSEKPVEDVLTNSQKTISTSNLSSTKKIEKEHLLNGPSVESLQATVESLKLEIKELNRSLQSRSGDSQIYHEDDINVEENQKEKADSEKEDNELTFMMQRKDKEAVCGLPDDNNKWYNDPNHLSKCEDNYPTLQSVGLNERSTSSVNRSSGRLGAEIATKNLDGKMNTRELTKNSEYFPIKLTAPHIVGVRSLLPPKYSVRVQNPNRAKSAKERSMTMEPKYLFNGANVIKANKSVEARKRDVSPKPVWMPTDPRPNTADILPKFSKTRGKSKTRKRLSTKASNNNKNLMSKSLNVTKVYDPTAYNDKFSSSIELSFLQSYDELETRKNLVDNSPYQQALARLRLERLRVEEQYLLQLKRESELERIRGPKLKWYETKGPQFHYECNKNTNLHKNQESWQETLDYRNDLLATSREFTVNMKGPVM